MRHSSRNFGERSGVCSKDLKFRRSRKTCGGSLKVAAPAQILRQVGSGFGAADYSAPQNIESRRNFKNRGEGFWIEPNVLLGYGNAAAFSMVSSELSALSCS